LRELLRNPLIIATGSGLLANLAGFSTPVWLEPTLSRIGAASLALGLMSAGAGMQLGQLARARTLAAAVLAIRHLVQPLMAWVLSRLFGLDAVQTTVLLAFSALPTASTCYVLAARMGYNGAYVAGLVTLSTLLGMASLPLALAALRGPARLDVSPAPPPSPHARPARSAPRAARPGPGAGCAASGARPARRALPAATARLRSQRMADAADRAALGAAQKLLFVQASSAPALPGRRARRSPAAVALGELVPGADQLAVVAAVDAVAHQRAQFQRDRAVVLDGQVGDAAPRIQPVRRHDGLVGQAMQALQLPQWALTARWRQGQVHVDLAQKEHRAASRLSTRVCLPRQPWPLRAASSASSTGAESVNTRWPKGRFRRPCARPASAGGCAAPCGSRGPGRRARHGLAGALQALKFCLASAPGWRGQIIHARGDHAHRARHQFGRPGA
jgi:hypothetical protein